MSLAGVLVRYAATAGILGTANIVWHRFEWWWRPPADPTVEQVKTVAKHVANHEKWTHDEATNIMTTKVLRAAIHEGWRPPA